VSISIAHLGEQMRACFAGNSYHWHCCMMLYDVAWCGMMWHDVACSFSSGKVMRMEITWWTNGVGLRSLRENSRVFKPVKIYWPGTYGPSKSNTGGGPKWL
jgi:hypothetical protein